MSDKVTEEKVVAVRADITHRFLAKFIDLLIAGALYKVMPSTIGFLSAVTYILIADGMPPLGQSLGKRLIGLKVVSAPSSAHPKPCNWKQSMIRNLPFVLASFAAGFSYLGVIIFIVGIILAAFESYFVVSDGQGIRLGDIFANTKVLDVK